MDVVLIYPDIPWNAGNIGRTCVATNTTLHLVEPLGFSLNDKFVQRSGLDYWQHLDLKVHGSVRKCLGSDLKNLPFFFFSRFGKLSFWKISFPRECALIFGSETKGLPKNLLKKYSDRVYRIPVSSPVRSLNLSSAVGIVLFEALRQHQAKPRIDVRREKKRLSSLRNQS